jgi:hypothetical protein
MIYNAPLFYFLYHVPLLVARLQDQGPMNSMHSLFMQSGRSKNGAGSTLPIMPIHTPKYRSRNAVPYIHISLEWGIQTSHSIISSQRPVGENPRIRSCVALCPAAKRTYLRNMTSRGIQTPFTAVKKKRNSVGIPAWYALWPSPDARSNEPSRGPGQIV